jgi:hypothetical protein
MNRMEPARTRFRWGLLALALVHLGTLATHPFVHLDEDPVIAEAPGETERSDAPPELCGHYCKAFGVPATPAPSAVATPSERALPTPSGAFDSVPLGPTYLRTQPRGPPAA